MISVRFEWDEAKNHSNQRKHDGVSFEEARQVFQDPMHVSVQDRIEKLRKDGRASVLMLVQSSDGLRWVPLSLKPNPQRQPG